ncbi:MAG: hypothetical protein LBP59_16630 [Planctomycetaceae bacterium]|nr:hypothetical protein [Planctomycetaceae bacterium]
MRKILFYVGMFFVADIIVNFMAIGNVIAHSADTMKAMKKLDNGYQTCIKNIQFKCDYIYAEGFTSSEEKAKKMSVADCEEITLKIHGQIVKSKRKTLISHFVDFDNYTPKQANDYIAVVNDALEAHYVSSNGSVPLDQLFVEQRTKESISLYYPKVTQSPGFTPFSYCPTSLINFVEGMQKYANVECSSKSIDNGNIKITFKFTGKQISKEEGCYVIYSVLGKYQTPTEYNIYVTPQNGRIYHNITLLRDFIIDDKKMAIPTNIVSLAIGMWRDDNHKGDKWLIREWKAENIDSSEIHDQDFFIPLNEKTSVGGLALNLTIKLKQNTPKHFDIDAYSLNDLLESTQTIEKESPSYFIVRLILMLVGAIMIFITLILWSIKLWRTKIAKRF